jgi:hypothetical protein
MLSYCQSKINKKNKHFNTNNGIHNTYFVTFTPYKHNIKAYNAQLFVILINITYICLIGVNTSETFI